MVSVISHVGVGMIFAEIILRIMFKDADIRTEKRPALWWAGFFGGLIPDLDAIPGYILGVHPYTYHHWITHTFLAVGIVFAIAAITKFKPRAIALFLGFGMHLVLDWVDNSISPLGPFLPTIEWGMLAGWGELPGGNWSSEYWLEPGYTFDHDLWSIFMYNGWGFPYASGTEFYSIYDIILSGIAFALFAYLLFITFKKVKKKKKEG
jgi:hypothetical protein